jgi:hypothetical protein
VDDGAVKWDVLISDLIQPSWSALLEADEWDKLWLAANAKDIAALTHWLKEMDAPYYTLWLAMEQPGNLEEWLLALAESYKE